MHTENVALLNASATNVLEEEIKFLKDENAKLRFDLESQMRLTKQSKLQIRKYEQLLNKCGAGLEQLSKDFSGRISSLMNELLEKNDGDNQSGGECEIFEDLAFTTCDEPELGIDLLPEYTKIKKESNLDDTHKNIAHEINQEDKKEPPRKRRKVEKNDLNPSSTRDSSNENESNILVLGTDWLAQTDHLNNDDNLTFTVKDCPACLLEIEPDEVLFRLPCSHSHHLECLQRIIQSRFLTKKCCSCQVPIAEETGVEITRAIKQLKKERKKNEKEFCLLLIENQEH